MLRRDFCVNIVADSRRQVSTELWIPQACGFHGAVDFTVRLPGVGCRAKSRNRSGSE